jgi:GNAT superfamily N-acetyltransferase
MRSEQTTRTLRDSDLGAVGDLLRSEWPEVDWVARFRRQWLDNPNCTPASPRGFVTERDGELLGFFGSIPLRYQVAGRPGLACIATALCVRAAARGEGIGRALVAAFDAQAAELRINATPNAATGAMFTQLGYARVDPTAGRRSLAHARQPFGTLRRALRARGSGGLRALLRGLRSPRRGTDDAFACAAMPAATDELDGLWDRHRADHPTTLWRDRAALQWLLFAAPQNTVIGCRDARGTLRGYAAFRAERGELRQMDVFPAHDAEVLCALGVAGADHAADRGLAVVRLLPVTAAAAELLEQHAFEPVEPEGELLVRGDVRGAWFTRVDGDRWL